MLGPQGARADGSWTPADATSCPRGRAVSRATEGRAGSVDHPRQVPRLQPGPGGRSWRRWAGASASRWAPVTSQPVPEPQAGPEASVLSGASLVPGRALLPAYLPSCHTSSS